MKKNKQEVGPTNETKMSDHPNLPLFPGLVASSTTSAPTKEVKQDFAADTQEEKAVDEENIPETVAQQAKRKSGSAAKAVHGTKFDGNNIFDNSFHSHLLPKNPLKSRKYTVEITGEKPIPTCAYRQHHVIGRFCFFCHGIEMPWGNRHPNALDSNGKTFRVAPQGALLEGVQDLTRPYEITQLAVLVELRMQQQSPKTIPGLVEALKSYQSLYAVARRIGDLVQELETLADESDRERVPNWSNVLYELLKEPALTRDQYFERASREWDLRPVNRIVPRATATATASVIPSFRFSTRENSSTQVIITREEAIKNAAKTHDEADVEELHHYLNRNESRGPGYVQFTLDFVTWLREGAHGTGRPAPQWGPHYVQQYHSVPAAPINPNFPRPPTFHENGPPLPIVRKNGVPPSSTRQSDTKIHKLQRQLNFSGRRDSEPSTTPRCSEETSDVEVYDSNDDENYGFIALPVVKKNTPGRPGVDWKFVEGSDLENAELGKPDPSKFYLTRQNVDDEYEIDVRQFAGIAGFDWNDPYHIKSLNKARAQNRHRVQGRIAETRIPWTQLEKNCLVEEVREAIKSGLNRHTIDWDDIASRLKSRFEGVLQKKGAKLAPGVEREPKKGKKDRTLKTSRSDRMGYNRNGSATETQALKYPDILQMINNATGLGGKGGRGIIRGPRRSLAQMRDEVKDAEDNRPTKKAKTILCRFPTSPSPLEPEKNHDDDKEDDDKGTFHGLQEKPAMKPAFDLKFTKSKVNQFDANMSKD